MKCKWISLAVLSGLVYTVKVVHASADAFDPKDTGEIEYNEAKRILGGLEETSSGANKNNGIRIGEYGLEIPQFNPLTSNYETEQVYNVTYLELAEAVSLLEKAALRNSVDALRTLGDLNIFGNFSHPTNYQLAKKYYEKAIQVAPDGHAYFMLGFIYSTGLFGEFEVNQHKANLYYQFAMENGDTNALLVLAYRHLKGIEVPANCEMALPLYAKLANMGIEWVQNRFLRGVDYNIRISDFNGGLFGEKLSETSSSIEIRSKLFADLKQTFEEHKFNADEHEYVTLYYTGMEHLKGDYFEDRNLTRAFHEFQKCVELGDEIYGANDYKNMEPIDRIYLSSCQLNLGRMYLHGLSIPRDVYQAEKFFNLSTLIQGNADAYNDLGVIEENGYLRESNISRAIEYYAAAISKKSPEANKNLAKLLMKVYGENPASDDQKREIYKYMKDATYLGNTQALYYMGQFMENGLAAAVDPDLKISCSRMVKYYAEFVRRLSAFYAPHLKYSFEQLVCGQYKNALVGYLIAAEQGFEPAQVSAAYLLYQLQPLSNAKKQFTTDRVRTAVKYLDRASKQGNVDATILIGDILAGVDSKAHAEIDKERSFNYYKLAADRHSSHGAYKLGEMYENGLVPGDNTTDYYLAKRYYDQSLQLREKMDLERHLSGSKISLSKAHINWALLRLRFKYLFNRKAFKTHDNGTGKDGWLSAFKKIGRKSSNDILDHGGERGQHQHQQLQQQRQRQQDSMSRADAQHMGGARDGEHDYVENYDIGDYLVIVLTFAFFSFFFIRNMFGHWQQMRNGQVPIDQNRNRQDGGQDGGQDGFNWNGNQIAFRRGNFEVQFFAL